MPETEKMMTRKRSESGSKRQLKEKVVQVYESLFKGEDIYKTSPTFWEEFFLLKPKTVHLESEIQKCSSEQLALVKKNINVLFTQCIETLGHEHNIRVVYSMQTLCALVSSVYRRVAEENGMDVINLLMGFLFAEEKMQLLLNYCQAFLNGIYTLRLKFEHF